jgi:concentrative nucleoside transporter, CNT family
MSERAITMATYALCGFANFSSIAIQVGGIGTIAPGRKSDLAKLGLKCLAGGMMAGLMTASIAGIFI